MKKKLLIIGGGFAGCCAAHMLQDKNFDIHIIENSNLLGGGVRTFWYGGHPYTFGPRHFLTENENPDANKLRGPQALPPPQRQ